MEGSTQPWTVRSAADKCSLDRGLQGRRAAAPTRWRSGSGLRSNIAMIRLTSKHFSDNFQTVHFVSRRRVSSAVYVKPTRSSISPHCREVGRPSVPTKRIVRGSKLLLAVILVTQSAISERLPTVAAQRQWGASGSCTKPGGVLTEITIQLCSGTRRLLTEVTLRR